MKPKTPKYTREAVARYQAKKYTLQVRVDVELKPRLEAVGLNAAAVRDLVLEELERREAENPCKY